MNLKFDERAGQWVAFCKVDGRPMLAYADTMKEAMTWLYEMAEPVPAKRRIPSSEFFTKEEFEDYLVFTWMEVK
jgi:hypothetical protein